MAEVKQVELDAIDDLRLRRWARQHYVTAEERDETWHPIVIDEMRRRDGEHRFDRPQGGIVPLAPHTREVSHIPLSAAGDNLLFRIDSVKPSVVSGAD